MKSSKPELMKDLFLVESIDSFIDELVKAGKIKIDKVVEFGIGGNLEIAEAFSKFRPIYYANDLRERTSYPNNINGMKIITIFCDALDVDGKYDVAIYNNVFWTITQGGRVVPELFKKYEHDPRYISSLTVKNWHKEVKDELTKGKFDTLLKYKDVCDEDISSLMRFIERDQEKCLHNLENEHYDFSVDAIFHYYTPCIMLDKNYQMLNEKGVLLIFARAHNIYDINWSRQIIAKMQEKGFQTFNEIGTIGVMHSCGLSFIYALKSS